ncbi:MAG TPA: hypothetical protein DF613_03695 [Lachnospiraceae bacterium]|nr:hypothetical protein [Lachnospiraceae bacterium]
MTKSMYKAGRMMMFCLLLALGVCLASAGDVKAAPSLDKSQMTLYVGDSATLKVKGTEEKPSFKSDKQSVATVSEAGRIKAKKAGTCTIKVKVEKKTLKCKVTVKKTIELSKYLNKNFDKLKKAVGKMKQKTDDPAGSTTDDLYVSNKKDPYGFFVRVNRKTKKLMFVQNYDRKNVTLYGVRLEEDMSSAEKKLLKKGFKKKKAGSYEWGEAWDFRKNGKTIRLNVTKDSKKIQSYQWS